MAYIVILNPIILSSGVDVDGNSLGFTAGRRRHRADRRCDDDPVRSRHPAAVRVRRRPRHQLVPRGLRRRPGDVARGDGPRDHQRPHHRAARSDRPAAHDLRRGARSSSSSRSRSASACSSPSSASSTPASSPSTGTGSPPVGLGIDGSVATVPTLIFVFTLLLDRRARRPQGQGRHPHRPRHRHRARRDRRGDLEHRAEVRRRRRQPRRLGPHGSRAARVARERPRPILIGQVDLRLVRAHRRRSPRSCSSSPSCSRTSSTRWAP